MVTKQKRYNINLFNRLYSILSDESEELISVIEKKANDVINAITDTALLTDEKQIVVLALLQITSELIKNDLQKRESCDFIKELSYMIDQEIT